MIDGNIISKLEACESCNLYKTRKNGVYGKGRVPSKYFILGDNPNKADEILKEPFSGQSGRLLDEMLIKAGINPSDCFYTSTVLCRPTDKKGGLNRKINDEEIIACASNILELYGLCKPRRVILVGKIAEKYYSKTFINHCCILHPEWFIKNNMVGTAYFMNTILKLKEYK